MNANPDRHPAQSNEEGKPHWPKGVCPISMGGLSDLGVDQAGNIYWDGKSVKIRKSFSLTWFQGMVAFFAALGAMLSGVTSVIELLTKS